MRTEAITEPRKMLALETEWNDLAVSCSASTIFQSYDWNVTWWRYFGNSPGRRLHLLCFRDDCGALIGLAPMMISPFHATPLRRLTFLGLGHSDYLDALAAPGCEDDVAQAFYDAIANLPGWDMVDLPQLRHAGFLTTVQPGIATLRSMDTQGEVCPYIELPDSWEAFLKALGKKTRANLGYYERSLAKMYDVDFAVIDNAEALDAEMEALFDLHQRRWNKRWLPGVFSTRRIQEFHKEAAAKLMRKDGLRLFVLRLDGATQAVLYCFAGKDRICYYQGGFEPALAKLSLGTILTARAIRRAIEEKKAVFDFLRGDEPYKSKWADRRAANTRRVITRRAAAVDPLVRYAQHIEETIEHRAKTWAQHRR